MQIDIITLSMGREKYLQRCLSSMMNYATDMTCNENKCSIGKDPLTINHYIFLQGCSLGNVKPWPDWPGAHKYFTHIITEPKNIGVGAALNKFKGLIDPKSDFVMKMDDDCQIISKGFFAHLDNIRLITQDIPLKVISPYPVGLIGNPGGVPAQSHHVRYHADSDNYYTFRKVHHIGGFARISSTQAFLNCPFVDDLGQGHSGNEDGVFSTYCNQNNIPMFYLENAMIVEHMESTLGQKARYKDYFKS